MDLLPDECLSNLFELIVIDGDIDFIKSLKLVSSKFNSIVKYQLLCHPIKIVNKVSYSHGGLFQLLSTDNPHDQILCNTFDSGLSSVNSISYHSKYIRKVLKPSNINKNGVNKHKKSYR